jgi:hypothetical protein
MSQNEGRQRGKDGRVGRVASGVFNGAFVLGLSAAAVAVQPRNYVPVIEHVQQAPISKDYFCGVLKSTQDDLRRRWTSTKNRSMFVRSLAALAHCAEPGLLADDERKTICAAITECIDTHAGFLVGSLPENMTPFHTLCVKLYHDATCDGGVESITFPELKELVKKIDAEIIHKMPVLSSASAFNEACRQTLSIVKNHKADMVILARYLLQKTELPQTLQDMMTKWRAGYEKKHINAAEDMRAATVDNLTKDIVKNLDTIDSVPSTVCGVDLANALWVLSWTGVRATTEDVARIREKILPVYKELVTVLDADTSGEGAKALEAFLSISTDIYKQ